MLVTLVRPAAVILAVGSLLLGVDSTSDAVREPHVLFSPSPALGPDSGTTAGVAAATAGSAAQVDAAPSAPVDAVNPSAGPGYGLNGESGNVAPWLPSVPTWATDMRVVRPSGSGRPAYILNRPSAGDRIDSVSEGGSQGPPPPPPPPPTKPGRPARPEAVSETDMYLLGAIEKLVYRVDFLEKRLRRAEELVYYLMEGAANKQDVAEPCPKDFTRAGRHCYHFAGRDLNWKSASSACKAMDSILVEVDGPEDKRDLVNWINAHQEFRGRDFWTGGLNPGLLWIWANSARPVVTASTSANNSSVNAIKNPGGGDIQGGGRCLKLAHNPATRQYVYQGGDCAGRHRFICLLEEPSASRALSRIHKSLNIRLDGEDPTPGPPAPTAVVGGVET